MGNEHSRDHLHIIEANISGENSAGCSATNSHNSEDVSETGRDSPRPSICSDGDIPYISYTVNQPIGSSPKKNKKGVQSLRSRAFSVSAKSKNKFMRPAEVVVVREGNKKTNLFEPELRTLQDIPSFLPIMRSTLTTPSFRDPEVLEKLNSSSLHSLCRRYQIHLNAAASLISSEQDKLTVKIKEIDLKMSSIMSLATNRQRDFAKYAEKFNQVHEINHALARCHVSLNEILASMEELNNALPSQERLEPFVWTTG